MRAGDSDRTDFVWAAGLALGSALIKHPHLGGAIRASQGATPTDFMSALYAGASSLSFVGASDFKPQSAAFQALYMLNSLIGMSVMALVLTYVMQIYNALRTRNTLGLAIQTLSDDTGDAAELIASLGPHGQFNSGFTTLSSLAFTASEIKESHHFYPLLFYFRFSEPYYSVSQTATVLFDTVSLLKSALRDEDYSWLKESATVAQCWRAAMLLVGMLEEIFLPGGPAPLRSPADAGARERWRTRFVAALDRMQQAGINTIADPAAGFETYMSLRARWDGHIVRLRTAMMYDGLSIGASDNRERITNLLPHCGKIAPPLDAKALRGIEQRLKRRDVAAFVMEPISINLGVLIPERDAIRRVRDLCRRHGTLFIADEVASGFGRTGRLFACEHFDLEPDMLCVAKAMSGGLAPIGAVIATAPIAASMEENDGTFYSTYGWHPRSVAAAIATLRDLKANRRRLLAGVAEMSEYFRVRLLQLEFDRPAAVRLQGLAIGLDVGDEDYADAIHDKCRRNGLLVSTEGSTVLLLPSLVIDKRTAARGLDILARSI